MIIIALHAKSVCIQATFLETIDEFRMFKNPRVAIFDETKMREMIPMKPIFYDLAYDMLESPKL